MGSLTLAAEIRCAALCAGAFTLVQIRPHDPKIHPSQCCGRLSLNLTCYVARSRFIPIRHLICVTLTRVKTWNHFPSPCSAAARKNAEIGGAREI